MDGWVSVGGRIFRQQRAAFANVPFATTSFLRPHLPTPSPMTTPRRSRSASPEPNLQTRLWVGHPTFPCPCLMDRAVVAEEEG